MYTMEEIFKLEEENRRKALESELKMAKEENNQNIFNFGISIISQQKTNIMLASMLCNGLSKDK